MKHGFKVGDQVEWSSEAGRACGTIKRRVTAAVRFKTYTVRASREEPQYLIKSDKTDHLAMHKGTALTRVAPSGRAGRHRPRTRKRHNAEGIAANGNHRAGRTG